jgi:hypothetical protein
VAETENASDAPFFLSGHRRTGSLKKSVFLKFNEQKKIMEF